MKSIALMIPTTSRGNENINLTETNIIKFLGLSLHSKILSNKYKYILYLGYDTNDTYFRKMRNKLEKLWNTLYPNISIIFHVLENTTTLVSKWNFLFKKAYYDNCDYFYQLGDDIYFLDSGWEEIFISNLEKSNGCGVTGPLDINNPRILTQSFTGRKHYDIFNYYFHPRISNWYCDDWITHVYPKKIVYRTTSKVKNMSGAKCRYQIDPRPKEFLAELLLEGRQKITKYIDTQI